jgi:hypothetical protein
VKRRRVSGKHLQIVEKRRILRTVVRMEQPERLRNIPRGSVMDHASEGRHPDASGEEDCGFITLWWSVNDPIGPSASTDWRSGPTPPPA